MSSAAHLLTTLTMIVLAATTLTGASQEPAPAAAPPAPAPSAGADSAATVAGGVPDYRLEPGDKLRIDVYKEDHLSQTLQVRPDGKITLPLVGDVAASGYTPLQLRDQLSAVLAQYVNKPVVTVVVVEATAPTAYVVGEVNRPGAVPVQGKITVLQAIALAGGLKDFADSKNIRILRTGGGSNETIPFNYKAALKGVGSQIYLRAGDTVVVPD